MPEIISKFGHGGPRANSGGARPNTGGAREGAGRKLNPPAPLVEEPIFKPRIIQRSPPGPRWHVLLIGGRSLSGIRRDVLDGEARINLPPRPSFNFYVPTQVVEVRRVGQVVRDAAGKPRLRLVPCYGPMYAFAQFDRDVDPWGTLSTVDGVRGLITTRSGIPIPLGPDWHASEVVQEQERMKLPDVVLPCFDAGQAVRFIAGPMEGQPAVCEMDTGLTTAVTAQVFGRPVPMTVRRDWLVAA